MWYQRKEGRQTKTPDELGLIAVRTVNVVLI